MFVDVRGFTALAEQNPPAETVARLEPFYRLAASVVFELDGTLDKMVVDQVVAFCGALFQPEDHAARAVNAALEIVSEIGSAGGHTGGTNRLPLGGGVATGEVFMGNVGEGEVRDFTVIGDVVNVAARLQGAAASGEVLVTEETYQRASGRLSAQTPTPPITQEPTHQTLML